MGLVPPLIGHMMRRSHISHIDAIAVRLAVMDEEQLFDHSFWVGVANKLPDLANDPEGTGHLVERFAAQYLPAHFRSKTQQDIDRVWLAFWHYLVAPRTSRKPFGLSSKTADLLIAEFQGALSQRG